MFILFKSGIGETLLNGLIGGLVPPGSLGIGQGGGYGGRCPLCDSSVFEYCSHKLLHDGCCCNGGRSRVHGLLKTIPQLKHLPFFYFQVLEFPMTVASPIVLT